MDADILVRTFELPTVQRVLADLRAAIHLDLGDECLTVREDDGLVVAAVRIGRDGTRSECRVTISESQRQAAELLQHLGVINAGMAEQAIPDPVTRAKFLEGVSSYTTMQFGVWFNNDERGQLFIYPEQ